MAARRTSPPPATKPTASSPRIPLPSCCSATDRSPVGTGRSGQAAARRQKALVCSEVRHTAQPPVDLLRRLELLLLVTIPHPVGDALRGDVTAGARTRWSPPCNPFPLISPPRH